jgi:RNA polymerase sigma-B factor
VIPTRAAATDRPGYEHLAPLFVEHAALPAGHPRRQALRSELINGDLLVAQHIARKYVSRGENSDDLEQVAVLGLILAVDRFVPERGTDFLAFAVPTSPARCCGTSGTGPRRSGCLAGSASSGVSSATPRRNWRSATGARPVPAESLVDHREALAPLLADLPDRERRILVLRFVNGLTQTEIAQQAGISQMHVSRLLSRTLARLRRRLDP